MKFENRLDEIQKECNDKLDILNMYMCYWIESKFNTYEVIETTSINKIEVPFKEGMGEYLQNNGLRFQEISGDNSFILDSINWTKEIREKKVINKYFRENTPVSFEIFSNTVGRNKILAEHIVASAIKNLKIIYITK